MLFIFKSNGKSDKNVYLDDINYQATTQDIPDEKGNMFLPILHGWYEEKHANGDQDVHTPNNLEYYNKVHYRDSNKGIFRSLRMSGVVNAISW